MEGSKEHRDEQDAGASGSAMSTHKGPNPQSQVDSKEGSEKGKGTCLALDTKKVNEKLLSQCTSHVNSAEISTQEADQLEKQSNGGCDPIEEKGFVESPGAAPASVGINTIELKSYSQKIDGKDPSHSNQQDSGMGKERSLEVKVDHQMAQEWTHGTTVVQLAGWKETKEVDMSNDMTPVDSSSGEEPTEETLVKEVKHTLVSTDETEEITLRRETIGLELISEMEVIPTDEVERELLEPELNAQPEIDVKTPSKTFLLDTNAVVGNETGTEEEQAAFMKELEAFHKERCLEFKPPRFYGEPLNCLKLWRAVIKLGGYEQVTSCKLWRQVGESFNPPKTCTTVSWTFRGFYEKALLEYEKHKMRSGELPFSDASFSEPSSTGNQTGLSQASGSGRARRDAAARAMQGWHSQRLLGNGEVGDPIIKDKNSVPLPKREKQLKSVGLLKRKRLSPVDHTLQVARLKTSKPQVETMVVDIGAPADWVKINVQRTKDCFEVYALVPGLLREEVRVQSDPAGRLVISGQPEQPDNPWGVTPFKKVVSLPSRIDPHQTSAVVTLHGQLFVRVPFEQADM